VSGDIVILGVFMADTAYRAPRLPRIGETLSGEGFALGPGGKGSNQAVAAAQAGGRVRFMSRVGRDPFAAMARETWAAAGISAEVIEDTDSHTGAAFIFVEHATGDNAIIIAPGAASRITADDVELWREGIAGAKVFVTQLEQAPRGSAPGAPDRSRGGCDDHSEPCPRAALPDEMLAQCRYLTTNESEAEALTGIAVRSADDAALAAAALRAKGAARVIVTLGDKGALFQDTTQTVLVPAFDAGAAVETTGAGDAFNGALAVALAEGADPIQAVRFGCAAAAISVTRPGAAASMPRRAEIDALFARLCV
jgi:ribokinase